MKNTPENKGLCGLRAIPLPRIIWESTLDAPEGYGHVSHAINSFQERTVTEQAKGGKTVERTKLVPSREHVDDNGQAFLTSENHGFYIGKFFPKPFRQRVMDLLGWSTPAKLDEEKRGKNGGDDEGEQTRIYSEELIEASLDYLYAHLKDGEIVQYVIGRHLSEIINGREDVAEALSAEEEEKLVIKIARSKFGKKRPPDSRSCEWRKCLCIAISLPPCGRRLTQRPANATAIRPCDPWTATWEKARLPCK